MIYRLCISPPPCPVFPVFILFWQITTSGASIGQSDDNTVAIPSDHMLAPLNHAIVRYEQTCQVGDNNGNHNHNNTGGSGSSEETLLSKDETTPTADGRTNNEGGIGRGKGGGREGVETNNNNNNNSSSAEGAGGFYFSDGGQETDFAAAFRIRVGEGNRDWPLTQVCDDGVNGNAWLRAAFAKRSSGDSRELVYVT